MFGKWKLCLISLFVSIVLAVLGSTPPSPQNLDTPSDHFSSARAMEDVRIISSAPHPTGSEENTRVRSYLSKRLSDLGLDVTTQKGELDERALARLNRWSGENKTSQELVNVVGVLRGSNPNAKALLLMAHHDTVWGSPGAADDTIGIATILEILRVMKDFENRQRDIIVLFTDAEEIGLVGARQFFAAHPLRDKVGAVINFEARGGGGSANMFQTSFENGNVARLYAKSVRQPSTSSLSIFVYNVLPNDTDLTPALEKDYVAYNIANIGRAEYYHSPKITPEALEENTLQHMGSQGLDLTRAMMSIDELPSKSPDVTFFDVFGFFTLLYSPFWGWIFLGLAVVFYGLSVKQGVKPKDIFKSCAKMLGFILIGGVALFALNFISGNTASADYYDRLAAIRELECVALLFSLGAFLAIFGRGESSENTRLGLALPIFVLGILGQGFAPTATYFISLSLLFTSIASFALSRNATSPLMLAVNMVLVTLVVAYMLVLGHLLMVGVGPDMLSVAILPAAIGAMALASIFPGISKPLRHYLAIASIGLSIGLALWIRFDPIAVTVPVY